MSTNAVTFRKDPSSGAVLLVLVLLLALAVLVAVPKTQFPRLLEVLNESAAFLVVAALGVTYWLLTIGSQIRKRFSLTRPGAALSALGQSVPVSPKVTSTKMRWLIKAALTPILLAVLHLSFAAEARTFVHFLAPTLPWPWAWFFPLVALLPSALAGADLSSVALLLLWPATKGSASATLPPWPEVNLPDGSVQITLGSLDETRAPCWLPLSENDLLKSFIVTGGVGFGKTQFIFRILDQLFSAFSSDPARKMAFLILDPKGDMVPTVHDLADRHGRTEDLIMLGSAHSTRWNPLYVRNVIHQGRFRDVAERFKAAMINYQGNSSSDPYWIEAGANLIGWMIWMAGASAGEVTFFRLYQLILEASSSPQKDKKDRPDAMAAMFREIERRIEKAKSDQESAEAAMGYSEQETNLKTCRLFIEDDWRNVPEKTRMNVVANLSSFLQVFLSNEAQRIFGPNAAEATFLDMAEILDKGKILVLDMTQNEQAGLCRPVGTMLKLSFQNAIMSRLAGGGRPRRCACLVLDEYQNFATSSHGATSFGDDRFFDQCRAAKGFGILATQSYATLKTVLGNEAVAHEVLGQVGHKITFATDDPFTSSYFKRLAGKSWVQRITRSFSENGANARRLLGDQNIETERTGIGVSTSISEVETDTLTEAEIATLPPFKAIAALKMSSGPQVLPLFTRPLCDPRPEGRFSDLKARLAATAAVLFLCSTSARATSLPPSICDAVKTAFFSQCLNYSTSGCTCRRGPISYPCTRVNYFTPKAYVEVSPRLAETYFSALPLVTTQISTAASVWNGVLARLGAGAAALKHSGAVDDEGSSFFHVHTAPVAFATTVFAGLPCGGGSGVPLCLSAMSEHHPYQWATGFFDLKQPAMLAQGAICGLSEGVGSIAASIERSFPSLASNFSSGVGIPTGITSVAQGCSLPLGGQVGSFAPSREAPCRGSLGAIFPRYGASNGPTGVSGALMAAYKFRSLAAEHFGTLPKTSSERWQMIKATATACLVPGENFAFWESMGVPAPQDRYLFLVWERTSCCVESVREALASAFLAAASAFCATK